ncbi:MAG: TlpA family protein disulfide reductase [Acidimicrobiales bacterium]
MQPDEHDQGRGSGRRRPAVLVALALAAALAAATLSACSDSGSADSGSADGPGADGGGSGSAAGDGAATLTDFEFETEDGSVATLAAYQGQPLVVNFFAAWCAPCRLEIPDLEAVYAASDGRVGFLGVNHDIEATTWRSFVDEVGISFPTVFQPNQEIWESLDLFGMPATVLIAPDGEVVATHSGIIDDETLTRLIADELGVEI